jgi:hypothetical protein
MFLPHTCNVYSIGSTKINGATREGKIPLHTWIKCMFYRKKNISLTDTGISRNTNVAQYDVILWWVADVKDWYIVELIDKSIGSLWDYRVHSVDINYSLRKNSLDNIHFTCSKI